VRQVLGAANPLAALGLATTASPADISRAFRQLALVLHPDKHAEGCGVSLEQRSAAFQALQQAKRRAETLLCEEREPLPVEELSLSVLESPKPTRVEIRWIAAASQTSHSEARRFVISAWDPRISRFLRVAEVEGADGRRRFCGSLIEDELPFAFAGDVLRVRVQAESAAGTSPPMEAEVALGAQGRSADCGGVASRAGTPLGSPKTPAASQESFQDVFFRAESSRPGLGEVTLRLHLQACDLARMQSWLAERGAEVPKRKTLAMEKVVGLCVGG